MRTKSLFLVLLGVSAIACLGCSGGDDLSKDPAMNTPSAADGPKVSDWAQKNPNNGAPGEADK